MAGSLNEVAGVQRHNTKRKLNDITDAVSAADLEDDVEEGRKLLQHADSKRRQNFANLLGKRPRFDSPHSPSLDDMYCFALMSDVESAFEPSNATEKRDTSQIQDLQKAAIDSISPRSKFQDVCSNGSETVKQV